MKHIFDQSVDHLTITKTNFLQDKLNQKLNLYVEGKGAKLTLSHAVPILENMGLSIAQCHLDEKGDGQWSMMFEIESSTLPVDNLPGSDIEQFLSLLLAGDAENDILNQLALQPNISLEYIPVLRALSHYLLQLQFNFGVNSLYKCLIKNESVTELLVSYFKNKFTPGKADTSEDLAEIERTIETRIDSIQGRDDDLICRRYFSVLKAITRTNFYKTDKPQNRVSAISFKIEPKYIDGIPKPVPAYEIFIYNTIVEGVHLRGGKVSRGGIRFSDRHEDYRTEVLGLVKTQMVKNSVIVPVGAKGGFICKADLSHASKDEYFNYIKACYEIFIRSILDITDNRVDGENVTPDNVKRYDDEDSYLVVAADKGTATFSDFANSIASEYGYWLGDAFASGGKNGYDHKKMGITAKGAWQSAKRLLAEVGKDIDNDPVSVVGIGDMSGDVFGNGMLLSPHIELIAAFNHKHIFMDPNPDASVSFAERKRLFDLPYSSWADYDKQTLSAGGSIYERTQKRIILSQEAAERLNISVNVPVTPDALIQAILCAEVDMLWNGGIGTYVKASSETDMDVSDKANDRVRIDATELSSSIVAEGGNLGLTQKARIEYALSGGLIHMDAVDNAGGVDCSDHEVNIKILLEDVLKDGLINHDQRNELLADMSNSVESLVLHNNFRQSKMLSQSNYTAPHFVHHFIQLINLLERDGVLDRELACIPSAEQIDTRMTSQEGFTRPEIATLLAYSKTLLFNKLVDSTLHEDSYFQEMLLKYFPDGLVDKYKEYVSRHPLRKEILASYLTNDIANRMGATFCNYAIEEDAGNITQLVKAHMIAAEMFNVNGLYKAIDDLLYKTESATLLELQLAIHYPLDKATSWLRRQGIQGDVNEQIGHYLPVLQTLKDNMQLYLSAQDYNTFNNQVSLSVSRGVNQELAHAIHALDYCYYVLPLASVANDYGLDADTVLQHFFRIGEELNIFWIYELIQRTALDDTWKRKNKRILITTIERHHVAALKLFLESDSDDIASILPDLQSYWEIVGLAKAKPVYHFSMVTVLTAKLGEIVNPS